MVSYIKICCLVLMYFSYDDDLRYNHLNSITVVLECATKLKSLTIQLQ